MITLFGEDDISDAVLDRVNYISEMLGCDEVTIETFNGTARVLFNGSTIIPEMQGFVSNNKDVGSWNEMLEIVVDNAHDYVKGSEEDYGSREHYQESTGDRRTQEEPVLYRSEGSSHEGV